MIKRTLSIVLAIVLLAVSMLCVLGMFNVAATSYSPLTGRSDFMFGVNIRGNNVGSTEYIDTYKAIIDSKSLGAQIIRVKNGNSAGSSNINYFSGLADIASQKGIELMFMESGIHEWVLKDDGTGNDKMPCTLDEVDEHKDDIINYYTEIATAYKDKVQYYQIGNEMDAESKSGGYLSASNAKSGRTESQFVDLRGIALGICLAQEAIKAVDPDAKIIVNTSWKDSGFIIKLKSYYYDTVNQYIYITDNGANRVPVAWDYTGLDFYAQSTSLYSDYSGVISDLTDLSEPVMIVEAGLKPVVSGNTVSFCGDADWLATFAQDMYSNSKVKAFINFELYDNVSNYGYNDGESYHGLIDYNGNKRSEYDVMQTLFGGTNVERPDVCAIDSSSELVGLFPEYLDETIHELNMYKIFSSGDVSNIFFNDAVSASINEFGDSTVLEFDMFVEDAAAFRAALDTSERTWFVALFGPNNTARYALNLATNLIEKNGWNHIAITRAQFSTTAGNPDLTGNPVTCIKIGYKQNGNYTNPASGLKLAFSNFCLTRLAPDMVDTDPRFDIREGVAISGTLGSGAITGQGHPNGYNGGKPAEVLFENPGLSDGGYNSFEFDCYIENYANFIARNTKLYVNLRENAASKATVEFTNKITTSGWNHIVISPDINSATLDSIVKVRFYMDINSGSTGASDSYMMANICATYVEDMYNSIPAMVDVSPKFDIYEGTAFSGTFGSTAITGQGHMPGYSPAQKTFAEGSTAGYGCFEFDFYLDDVSIITARNTKLYLNLRSGSGSGTSRGLFEFQNQLTGSGWNHVKVKTGLADDKLEILTMARFYIDIDVGSTGASDRYRIANICATKEAYSLVPDMIEASPRFDIFEGAAVQCVLGSEGKTGQAHLPGYNSTTPAQKTFTNTGIGNLGLDVFEFDFYVDNAATISARNVKLYFNLRTSGNASKATFEFQNQIIADGWNHVKIATGLSTSVLNEIGMTRFFIDMDVGSTGATDRLRVANICATQDAYKSVPAMPSVTPRCDIYEGAALQGTFGSSAITSQGHLPGYSPAQKTFAAGSVSGCDCFEFDFYLDDISIIAARNTKLYLNLRSGTGGGTSKGTYEFQSKLTASGWNHVKIYTALSSDVIDTLTMARFYIDIDASGTGATDRYRVANICSTKFATPEKHNTQGTTVADLNAGNGLTNSGWKEGRYNSAGCYQENLTAVNLYGSDYIELDIYVENKQAILDAIADLDELNGDKNTRLRLLLSSTSGDYRGSNYTNVFYLDSFENYIISDGWNHMAIPVSEFDHNGNATLKSISSWGIDYYEATSDTNIAKDWIISVCNICGTKSYTDIQGDVNNDGVLDAKDMVAAKRVAMNERNEYNINFNPFVLGLMVIRKTILGFLT